MGTIVCFTSVNVHSSWMVALPLGAVFFGLFLIAYLLQGEVARFDEEEARKRIPISRHIAGTPVRTSNSEATFASIQLRPESAVFTGEL